MTTQTTTLADFLLARVAEDEAMAREAVGVPWVVIPGVDASMVNVDPTVIREEKWKYGRLGHVATTTHDGSYAEHIARHDPARVLAECEAKRRIVEQWDATQPPASREDHHTADELELTMTYLAAVYADHPDYRDEWRP